jgi:hypothetical protein
MVLTKREDTIGCMTFFAGATVAAGLIMATWYNKSIALNLINVIAAIGLIGTLWFFLKVKKLNKTEISA